MPEPLKCEDFVSLEKYMDARMNYLEGLFTTQIEALEDIVNKTFELNTVADKIGAENLTQKLAAMNELRGVVEDQQMTFLQITEFKGFQVSQVAEWKAHVEIQQKAFDSIKDQMNKVLAVETFNAYKEGHHIATEELKKRIADVEITQKLVETKAGLPMVWIVGAGSVIGLILSIISLMQKWVAP